MKTEIIQTASAFFALRDEWNELLQDSQSDCVFLTHEWLSAWWQHLSENRRLYVVTVREGEQLVGVLPLAERAPQLARMMPRTLEFLGSGIIGSDYLDAIVRRGWEQGTMPAFAEELNRRGFMLQLSQLRANSSVAEALAGQLRGADWKAEESKINICPYINLSGHTWDSYVGDLGPQVRKGVKRYLRNLPKSFDFRLECVTTPTEAAAALTIVIDLHRRRWGNGNGRKSEAFHSEAVVAFHRDFVQLAAEQGWLRLLIIYLNGEPAAALYGLRYGPTFYFYQSGFDPAFSKHSVGVATMALSIKTAIEEGANEYDFLHGDEEYKFHWAREVRDLRRIELHPPQALAWIYKGAIQLNRTARQMARRMLQRASNVAVSR